MTTLLLRGEDAVVATVTVAALHGNCLKGDNTCLSADFVGAFRRVVGTATNALALFAQGCAGNLNPIRRGGIAEATRTGEELARAVIDSFDQTETVPDGLAATSRPLSLAMRPVPPADQAERLAAVAAEQWGQDVSRWRAWQTRHTGEGRSLPATLTAIAIGDVALGGVPWELFCEIGLEASRRLGDRALLLGHVNGYYGYLATPEENRRGGYEIDWMPVVYGVNMGMGMPMADDSAERVINEFDAVVAALT